MSFYLFFVIHALNIYKEYAEAGSVDGADHVWQVKYVFVVLLAIAASIFHASSRLNQGGTRENGNMRDVHDFTHDAAATTRWENSKTGWKRWASKILEK